MINNNLNRLLSSQSVHNVIKSFDTRISLILPRKLNLREH